MPFALHPLYIHGESALILGISQSSPLSGYLSRGDVIFSVDGENIRSPHQLIEKMFQDDWKSSSNKKGYCAPKPWLEESNDVMVLDGNLSCPEDHAAFIGFPCLNFTSPFEINSKLHDGYKKEIKGCFSAEQVVKLSKCGEGWGGSGSHGNHCTCTEVESCITPILRPGISWFEISFSNSYSSDCLQQRRNTSSVDSTPGYNTTYPCGVGTFVYVGDKVILAHSIRLSAYHPRSMHYSWIMDVPATLENMLESAYHISAALAALNSLPVFFLDGEYILEGVIGYITGLTPRKRRKAVQVYLVAGTILSAIAFSRIIYFTYFSVY